MSVNLALGDFSYWVTMTLALPGVEEREADSNGVCERLSHLLQATSYSWFSVHTVWNLLLLLYNLFAASPSSFYKSSSDSLLFFSLVLCTFFLVLFTISSVFFLTSSSLYFFLPFIFYAPCLLLLLFLFWVIQLYWWAGNNISCSDFQWGLLMSCLILWLWLKGWWLFQKRTYIALDTWKNRSIRSWIIHFVFTGVESRRLDGGRWGGVIEIWAKERRRGSC